MEKHLINFSEFLGSMGRIMNSEGGILSLRVGEAFVKHEESYPTN